MNFRKIRNQKLAMYFNSNPECQFLNFSKISSLKTKLQSTITEFTASKVIFQLNALLKN